MTKSITRKARREAAKRIANKVLKTHKEGELPTVEQLYTIIGAKDGFIYDLQSQLQGFAQERETLQARIDELEAQLMSSDSPEPVRVADVIQLNAKDSGAEIPEDTFEKSATFRPR